jgi:hypothetical protein
MVHGKVPFWCSEGSAGHRAALEPAPLRTSINQIADDKRKSVLIPPDSLITQVDERRMRLKNSRATSVCGTVDENQTCSVAGSAPAGPHGSAITALRRDEPAG